MLSECIVFIIDKIPVFIFCDRWFPGTLAVGSASRRLFFVFALMWPLLLCRTWLDIVTESLQIEVLSVGAGRGNE